MNSRTRSLAVLALGLALSGGLQAQNLPGNNNPYNSPIKRANPNSMQGTQPNTPAARGTYTAPVPRPPTWKTAVSAIAIRNVMQRPHALPPNLQPRHKMPMAIAGPERKEPHVCFYAKPF